MRWIRVGEGGWEDSFSSLIKRGEKLIAEAVEAVRPVVEGVRHGGDKALLDFTERFDGVRLREEDLALGQEEMRRALSEIDPALRGALEEIAERIRVYHEHQKERSWLWTGEDGRVFGELVVPLESVGIYVPGGGALYPSSVLMSAIPARVASVKRIVVCSPPGRDGSLHPALLAAAAIAGIHELYRVGGAQAVAAMALGTGRIRAVEKVVGPGGLYPTAAKKLLYGEVDIDMLAGPSEVAVVADGSARASFVAADLLAQAEHDEAARAILITLDEDLGREVEAELERQLKSLPRAPVARRAIEEGGAICLVRSIEEAASLTNRLAPEHLELQLERPWEALPLFKAAGAIFLGPWSPVAAGDYGAGPNHVLPTGGGARWGSPLGVYHFLKRTSLLALTREGLREVSRSAALLAELEGLGGHVRALLLRESP
ncbi:MAG: histidinol dehydrogenase [Nitrospinota bacterium]